MITIETLNKIASFQIENLQNKRESHREIFTALEIIRATHSKKEKIQQLALQDTTNNTLGHFCLQGNEFQQVSYEDNLLKLGSENILSILLITNNNLVSILDLYITSSLDFFNLAYKLTSKDLYILLSKNNLFIKIIFEKSHHNNFLEHYWRLLKRKFNHFEGQKFLSQLLNLDCEAKFAGGELFGHEMAKQAKTDSLLDYIAFLSILSKEIVQPYLNRLNDDKETFISLIIRRIKNSISTKLIQDEVRIIVKLLVQFDFDKATIQTLVNIQGLKAHVRNYLINLGVSNTNLRLLQNTINQHTSLGKFCGEWMSFSGKYIKNETTTITILRTRVIAMQNELSKINTLSQVHLYSEYPCCVFFSSEETANFISKNPNSLACN
jgi:hypothetical protein